MEIWESGIHAVLGGGEWAERTDRVVRAICGREEEDEDHFKELPQHSDVG